MIQCFATDQSLAAVVGRFIKDARQEPHRHRWKLHAAAMQQVEHHLDPCAVRDQSMCFWNRNIDAIAAVGNHIEAKVVEFFLDNNLLTGCIGVTDKEVDIACQTLLFCDLPCRKQPVVGPTGQACPMFGSLQVTKITFSTPRALHV